MRPSSCLKEIGIKALTSESSQEAGRNASMRGGFEPLHARLEISIAALNRAHAAVELREGDRDQCFDLGDLFGNAFTESSLHTVYALCDRLYLAAKVVG